MREEIYTLPSLKHSLLPGLLPGLVTALCAILCSFGAYAAERPNILLLMAEDLSPRIGAFGDPVALTPNLDALAKEGVRYTNTFTTAGVCAPSRVGHIMGMNQISFGAQHMRSGNSPGGGYQAVPPAEAKAYPELLRAAGYYTYTDNKLDYQFSGAMAGSGPLSIWNDEGSGTDWQAREPGQSFFGLINFLETHESGTFAPLGNWPQSFLHLLMQVTRAVTIGRASDNAPVLPGSVPLPPYYPDIASVRTEMARHYNNIHAMDARVGNILAELERDGLAENTIIIWTTDHGDGLPRAKRELYDSGIHVPMIIRWPEKWRPRDVVPGALDKRLISFVDFAPTVLALAGVETPPYLQGRNFIDPNVPPREYIYAARDRIDEVMDRQRAVRDQRYKYIRSWHPEVPGGHPLAFRDIQAMTREMRALWRAGELTPEQARWFEAPGEEQLYDMENDPHELHNLAGEAAYRKHLERLRAALDEWLIRVGDTSAIAEETLAAGFRCDDKQCVTAPPRIQRNGQRISLNSETAGASLVYQLDGGRWQLYTEPFTVTRTGKIAARAQRYGWKPSREIVLPMPTNPMTPVIATPRIFSV